MVIEPGNSINSHNAPSAKARQQEQSKPEAGAVREKASAPASDSVSLSEASKTIAQIEAKLSGSSEIDMAKVAEVKASIADGSYEVNSENIANKLFQDETLLG